MVRDERQKFERERSSEERGVIRDERQKLGGRSSDFEKEWEGSC